MREVGLLRAEVQALRAELETAHRRIAELEGIRRASVAQANRERLMRSAEVDLIVLRETARLLPKGPKPMPVLEHLHYFGFPYFRSQHRFAQTLSDHLNRSKIAAPRGGLWSSRQVTRAWTRVVERLAQSASSSQPG